MQYHLAPGGAYGWVTCFLISPFEGCPDEQKLPLPTSRIWTITSLPAEADEAVMGPLNEWLASLPVDTTRRMFSIILTMYENLRNGGQEEELEARMSSCIADLHVLIDYDQLSHWVRNYGNVCVNNDIPEVFNANHSYGRETTYIREEYYDLITLHFYLKLLAPFWPDYLNRFAGGVREYRELAILRLLDQSPIQDLPPMLRLREYIAAKLLTADKKAITSAKIQALSMAEIEELALATILTRNLPIAQIRNPDRALVKDIHNATARLGRNLGDAVNESRSSDEGQEDDSLASRVRVSQKVGDHHIARDEVLLLDIERVASMLVRETLMGSNDPAVKDVIAPFLTGDQPIKDYHALDAALRKAFPDHYKTISDVDVYRKLIDQANPFHVRNYHFQISAIVLNDILVDIRSLLLMEDRDAVLNAFALAASWLANNGYVELAAMLVTETHNETFSGEGVYQQSALVISPISKDSLTKIEELYPHVKVNTQNQVVRNPGIEMLEAIRDEVISVRWPGKTSVPEDLLNNIVNVLYYFDQLPDQTA